MDFDVAYRTRPFLFGKDITPELKYVVQRFKMYGKALELGCGDGRDTMHMLQYGFSIDAIEKSTSACQTLCERTDIDAKSRKRLEVINEDVSDIKLTNAHYDFIYSVTLFDHLFPEKGIELIKLCIDALKDGGYFFIKVHTVDDVGNTHLGTHISEFSDKINHFYSRNELLEMLGKYGMIVYYLEAEEDDYDHGEPHKHAFATAMIRKEKNL